MNLPTYLSFLNRRQWLKVLLLGSVTNTASGTTLAPSPNDETGTAPASTPPGQPVAAQLTPSSNNSAIIPIRVSDFPGLAAAGGSIALYFSNLRFPIVINRDDGDVFYALDPTCTHQGCQVGNYNPSAFSMQCDCHGSVYTIAGKVAVGPAQYDLDTYPSHFDGTDLLEVELVGVPLRIDRVGVQSRSAGGLRLRLDFPGVSGCQYQVKYHADLVAPAQPARFALSASGPADRSSFIVPEYTPFNPLSGDGPKTIWVDAPGPAGFFALELVLGEEPPLE
jgi:cytochrome b6-f complex iron-sulfur subunit